MRSVQLVLACLICLCTGSSFSGLPAQSMDHQVPSPPGLPDTTPEFLREYRLPAWGYTRWSLDLDGHVQRQERTDAQKAYQAQRVASILNQVSGVPSYHQYSESETAVREFTFKIPMAYEWAVATEEEAPYHEWTRTIHTERTESELTLHLEYLEQYYFLPEHFVEFQMQQEFRYNDFGLTKVEKIHPSPRQSRSSTRRIDRVYRGTFQLGVGTGHLRDVSPMIRALRWHRRYRQVTGRLFDATDIHALARHFTRRPGYVGLYDRPEKYFYAELPDAIAATLQDLEFAEALYVTDAFREAIGRRREGSQLQGALRFDYGNSWNSREVRDYELALLGPSIAWRWSRNYHPRVQIGSRMQTALYKVMNRNTGMRYVGEGRVECQLLWSVLDRIIVVGEIGWETTFGHREHPDAIRDVWQRGDRYTISLTAEYFLENRVAFITNGHGAFLERWSTGEPGDLRYHVPYITPDFGDMTNWVMTFGLRYYFGRSWL